MCGFCGISGIVVMLGGGELVGGILADEGKIVMVMVMKCLGVSSKSPFLEYRGVAALEDGC